MSKPTEIETTAYTQISPRYTCAVQLLGKRWTALLLHALLQGPLRFSELVLLVEGLSDRVLSDRLRELEAEEIVQRVVYPQTPVYILAERTQARSSRSLKIACKNPFSRNRV